ncbi:MAG: prenyltransferase/squalene oxidase repeat-containing protein [Gammaproteobacteria bacterium]
MMNNNPYLHQINKVLPRLLALYDRNTVSATLGYGDRYYWAWKLIDFNNATFQGAAHGLARLLNSNLLNPEFDRKSIQKRILQMALSIKNIRDANGSVCEAFPHESSFCVTALLAYDLLSAVELLRNTMEHHELDAIIKAVHPLIQFISKHDEHHGIISNHLATATVALYKYHALTGENTCARGKYFLDKILTNQSDEGWYREYEGADPGYQSLCTYYLADLHRLRPDLGLLESLTKSIRFLSHFAHPDGSFGGVYGSRNTRFYYPAGIELLRHDIKEAASLADFMQKSISMHTTVTLETMDEPNLIPMFNAYCIAAASYRENEVSSEPLPCHRENLGLVHFPKAGMIICGDKSNYTIIATHKGGVCYSFPKDNKDMTKIDTGIVYQDAKGKLYSNQTYQSDNNVIVNQGTIEITTQLSQVNQPLPSPTKFVVLRVLLLTIMRNQAMLSRFKKMLVWLLMNRKKKSTVGHVRRIHIGKEVTITDETHHKPNHWLKLNPDMPFTVIHMASQGYWQKQDDAL